MHLLLLIKEEVARRLYKKLFIMLKFTKPESLQIMTTEVVQQIRNITINQRPQESTSRPSKKFLLPSSWVSMMSWLTQKIPPIPTKSSTPLSSGMSIMIWIITPSKSEKTWLMLMMLSLHLASTILLPLPLN